MPELAPFSPPKKEIWPTEIRLMRDKKGLFVAFNDGFSGNINAELLRVKSPSAEVQGHNPTERKLVSGKAEVMIINIEAVGNYAIRLSFDDMHDTGIYAWPFLYNLAQDHDVLFAKYEKELTDQGLSRTPLTKSTTQAKSGGKCSSSCSCS